MPLTKEQLMKPRYKLFADYPGLGGDMPVGTIFTLSDELAFDKFPVWKYSPYGHEFGTWNRSFEHYHHLFKPLQWWEERQQSDMPEYVMIPNSCCIQDKLFDKGTVVPIGEIPKSFDSYKFVKPATLEEYIAYQSSQKVK